MNKFISLLVMLALAAVVRAQNGTPPVTTPANERAGTILDDLKLQRLGLVKPSEAGPLLAQFEAQEKQLLAQRQAAYVAMQGKSEQDQMSIWRAMIEAQKDLLAEHRALEKRLSAALKDQREKAGAAQRPNGKPPEAR